MILAVSLISIIEYLISIILIYLVESNIFTVGFKQNARLRVLDCVLKNCERPQVRVLDCAIHFFGGGRKVGRFFLIAVVEIDDCAWRARA
jgi:hypothetical protein